jgi:hypothetical protein
MDNYELVKEFLSALRVQIDTINSMSAFGAGGVLAIWGSKLRINNNLAVDGFRWAEVLLLPFGLFIGSIILGYFMSASIAGYHYEILNGRVLGKAITVPARTHFLNEYQMTFKAMSTYHIALSLAGIIGLALWFIANVAWGYHRRDTHEIT